MSILMRLMIWVLVYLFSMPLVFAGTDLPEPLTKPTEEKSTQKPTRVIIGSYVYHISDINLKENRAGVDFYLWFRWQGEDIKPHETAELMNGVITQRTIAIPSQKMGEDWFSTLRIQATLHVSWDLARFPLDRQTIPIQIEDNVSTTQDLVYVADRHNSSIYEGIWLSLGYRLANNEPSVVPYVYKTNFGDINLPPYARSVYSRYTHEIMIKHSGVIYFFKLFAIILLLAAITIAGFSLNPENIQVRVQLSSGILFAVVASSYVIVTQLPATNQVGLPDRITMFCIFVPAFSLLMAVFHWKLTQKGYANLVRKMDRFYLITLPFIYVFTIATMIFANY